MKLSKWEPLMAMVLLALVYMISSQAGRLTAGVSVKTGKEKPVVVIDAGHGGS